MFRKYGKVVKKLLTQRFYFYFFRGFPNIVKSTLGLTHPKKWTTHQMNAQKKIKSSCAVVCSEPACFPFNPRLNLRLKVTTTQPLNILQWMIWQSSDLEVMWSAKSKIQWQLYHVIQKQKVLLLFPSAAVCGYISRDRSCSQNHVFLHMIFKVFWKSLSQFSTYGRRGNECCLLSFARVPMSWASNWAVRFRPPTLQTAPFSGPLDCFCNFKWMMRLSLAQ